MKVAQTGGSVADANKDLAMTSEETYLCEVFSGYVDLVTDGSGSGSATFVHGLNYKPSYYSYCRDPLDTTKWYPQDDMYMGVNTKIDDTTVYFDIDSKEPSSTYRINYRIFGNQLEDLSGTGNNNVFGKLRISKPGYDARTETDARNMQFFSGANVFKIDDTLSGGIAVVIDDFINEFVIPHNLGYVPVCFVMNDTYLGAPYGAMLPSTAFSFRGTFKIDATNLTIITEDDFGGSLSDDATFKYKITRDKIA